LPGFPILKPFPGSDETGIEIQRFIAVKAIASPSPLSGIVVSDGIDESPGTPDNGYATITQGNELTNTAGFKATGHEECIGTTIDPP
jgi:hypothetical protein